MLIKDVVIWNFWDREGYLYRVKSRGMKEYKRMQSINGKESNDGYMLHTRI